MQEEWYCVLCDTTNNFTNYLKLLDHDQQNINCAFSRKEKEKSCEQENSVALLLNRVLNTYPTDSDYIHQVVRSDE